LYHSKKSLLHAMPRFVPSFNDAASVLDETNKARRLQTLQALQAAFEIDTPSITSDDVMICLDSGCSIAITNDVLDFQGPLRRTQHATLNGIASGLMIAGIGQLQWTFLDVDGVKVKVPLLGLYVPGAPADFYPHNNYLLMKACTIPMEPGLAMVMAPMLLLMAT